METSDLGLHKDIPGVFEARQNRSIKNRDGFIRAGIEALNTSSFDDLKISDLAKASGNSVGSFYTRFQDKDAYFRALRFYALDAIKREIVSDFTDDALRKMTPGAALDSLVDLLGAIFASRFRGVLRENYSRIMEPDDPWAPIRVHALQIMNTLHDGLGDAFPQYAKDEAKIRLSFCFQIAVGVLQNDLMNNYHVYKLEDGSVLPGLKEVLRRLHGAAPYRKDHVMAKQSNIVLIFTDNQQASTLGCYGNAEVHTPNVDALSERGVTFDNAFCPNGFCSPCRASVLTGKLPSQHGVHSWIDDRKSAEWPSDWHALDGLNTLPKLLKSEGYATALVGKYHLGQPTSPAEGFDHWVTLEDGHVRSFYRNKIFDNGEVYEQPGHSVDFFTDKGVAFIEEQTAADTPFFLYLPYPAPYGHWPATKETDENRHTARYADCPMDSIPRVGLSKEAVDGFMLRSGDTSEHLDFSMLMRAPNDLGTVRNFYSQISMVDDGVGKIIATLDRLGIADDTLLIFTTDHGLSTGHHGFWGHGAATMPSNLHRAAHSIPMIMHQPGVTAQGVRSQLMVSGLDVFATVLEHAGVVLDDQSVPSRSLMPILTGSDLSDWGADIMFSEQEETRVVRTPKWAYFKRFDNEKTGFTDALFDVEHDPDEASNLAGDPAFAEIISMLDSELTAYFETYAEDRADLWKGGLPIQHSERKKLWSDIWGDDWRPVYSYGEA